MIIRKINKNDINSLAELYKEFWGEKSNIKKMIDKYDEIKNNGKYIILCAVHDKKVVGTVMGIICDELYGECNPFMIIEDLVVHSKYRRIGIGEKLMNTMYKYAKRVRCSQILFITEKDRRETIKFYESLGYNAKTHVGFKMKVK